MRERERETKRAATQADAALARAKVPPFERKQGFLVDPFYGRMGCSSMLGEIQT